MRLYKIALCTIALLNAATAQADDKSDFRQQINGWEWIYQEPCKRERIEYPQAVNFYVYDSHPEYRIIEKQRRGKYDDRNDDVVCIYDKNGKLVRVACLLQEHTVNLETYDSYLQKRKTYLERQWQVLGVKTIHQAIEKTAQLLQPTKNYTFQVRHASLCIDEFNSAFQPEQQSDLVILKGNPYPKNFQLCIGYVYPLKKWKDKRKAEFEQLFQHAPSNTSSFRLHYVFKEEEDAKRAPYEIWAVVNESCYDSIYRHGETPNNHYQLKQTDQQRFIDEAKEQLLTMMMREDYYNNKYNINQRESQATLHAIEVKLGLRKPTEVSETDIFIKILCELLRVNHHSGITRNQVAELLREKYPYKDDMEIQEMIVEAFQKASALSLLALNEENRKKEKLEEPARNYLSQLRSDHWGDNEITSIERTGNTGFKVTFNTKTSKSKFYAYIHFYTDEPYSFKAKIDIKAE